MSAELAIRLHEIWSDKPGLYGWFATVDHKKLGKRYIITALLFLVIGGVEALVIRTQLAGPNLRVLTAEQYNQMFSMHGVTMIFWYAQPILTGFSVYLVPMLIGARDMAFPRLNAFTYWTFVLSGILLYISPFLGMAPHGGWFAYVPYTNENYSPGLNMDFYALSLMFLTISSTGGAINFIATVLRLRAPGMSVDRMPIMLWSTTTISFVTVFALPALTAALMFLELDRQFNTHFYEPAWGGDPMLWQQLFWMFGHPWVYIIFLPATGMISMIIPVFSRRPIVGYTWVVISTVLTGVVGFGVWVHHMFATGLPQVSMSFFSAASMTISILSTIQVFAWIATMWTGTPVFRTPMLFATGFIFLFVIGGLSGVMTAVIPFDWQLHDTYFVVAHIHFVLIGANVFPVFSGLYYWLPKVTGRLMDERTGKVSFWMMFAGMLIGFFPMHITGMVGMPRRIFTYPADAGWTALNAITTAGAALFAAGVLVSFINFLRSARTGIPAGSNPWNADTLEWDVSSPPPSYGTEHIPTVRSRHPLWDAHEEEEDPLHERVLANGRETLSTTTLDAVEYGVAKMSEDTLLPVFSSVTLGAVFTFLVWKLVAAALIAAGVTALLFGYWMWPKSMEHVA